MSTTETKSGREMPVLFIGHGSPDLLLHNDPVLEVWRKMADSIPRPQCVLVVTSHWETTEFVIGANHRQHTLHDFHGFPAKLYEYRYPALPATDYANELANRLGITTDHARGLDHAAWVPMLTMYPQADVPVMQISVSPQSGYVAHMELGRRLSFLREQGVLILASGVLVHNLSRLDWSVRQGKADEWAKEFIDEFHTALVARDERTLCAPHQLHSGQLAIPSPEHYLPFLVAYGASRDNTAYGICQTWRHGSLSMHSYCFTRDHRDIDDVSSVKYR